MKAAGHKSLEDLSGKISYKPERALPPAGAREALGSWRQAALQEALLAPLKPAGAADVTSETIQPTEALWETPALNS